MFHIPFFFLGGGIEFFELNHGNLWWPSARYYTPYKSLGAVIFLRSQEVIEVIEVKHYEWFMNPAFTS